MIGQTVSHYKILEKLGEGGMGEVYLAQDSGPLGREVALKFVAQEMQEDPAAKRRFLREAKLAAALDHPYICHIHEVGEAGEQSFISMQYIRGQTLQARLAKGPLELKDALQKATEIAEALEAAHKQNIVHRDLKPANIMLTPEGHVKVMDFGLAKRLTPAEGPDSQENTLSSSLTASGATLGTLPYMSPEQVQGQELDPRSDIFSFGVLFYEMLTGVHPFKKDTPVETANALLKEVPAAVTRHLDNTPGLLQHMVRKMLAKEPDRRYQLVHDVRTDLGDLISSDIADSGETQVETAPVPATAQERKVQSRWRQAMPLVAIALLALATGLFLDSVLWNRADDSESTQPTVAQFPVVLPEGATLRGYQLALSPDGTQLVYAAYRGGTQQLYVRALPQVESKPIPHTEGAMHPFFSPDGQWVAFFSHDERALKKVSLMGGTPQTLCEVRIGRGGSWGQDGTIVFGQRPGIWRVSDAGGTPEELSGVRLGFRPQILPGGKAVVFARYGEGASSIGVLSLETGEEKVLIQRGRYPRYAPTGHLIYALDENLLAAPFDLKTLKVTGDSKPVLEGLWRREDAVQYSLSENGTLAYIPRGGLASGGNRLSWVDRQGEQQPVTDRQRDFASVRFLPDGKRLGVGVGSLTEGIDVWIYEIARGILSPLTTGGAEAPIWTPDGTRLAFARPGSGLFWMAADGSGKAEQLMAGDLQPTRAKVKIPFSWSPDGNVLAFAERVPSADWDISLLPLGGEPQPFLATEFLESQPMFSPDGRWIAFTSGRSGRAEVYVKRYPEGGGIEPISTDGGVQPLWAHDGRELFYRNGEKVMVVSIQTKPTLKAEAPRRLFTYPEGSSEGWTSLTYDIAPDDQRFVFIQPGWPTQINVVLNWFEELKRLVPSGN